MSRYYDTDQVGRTNDSRQNNSANRISLPEFIPFTNDYESKDQKDIPIPPPPSTSRIQKSHQETRSPSNYRNLAKSSPNRQSRENGNGRERRSSRESHRSNNSYDDRNRSRNRSRSRNRNRSRSRTPPRQNESRFSPPSREHEYREREQRERSRQASVFDRMSSPPVPRRKNEGSRRSNEPNHGNGQMPSHLFRTVNAHANYDEHIYQNIEPVRYRDLQSPSYDAPRRYVAEPIARPVIMDDTAELRSIRERLVDAETHCFGLETTVRAYEREIHKLRLIVNTLIDDFEIAVQSRHR